ncbi:T9SS type A sorting domain-containing protein [Taibaiella koreensis]|uniref:T9SS type A sorting domain-containing protein n=1 Tax=Taibaiella koreensis TaxID=1268548 RepID=UPI000E59B036|nr:T9SS type A sorting domain-containing protein [Taibaiella koreensis]
MAKKLHFPSRALSSCLFLLFIAAASARAQQGKWVVGGGSPLTPPPTSNAFDLAKEIATDEHGNVYMLTEFMGSGNLVIDTITFPVQSGISSQYQAKTALLSFNCDGRIRWGKVLEGTNHTRFTGLACRNGNVYIAGSAPGGGAANMRYFGPDSTMSANFYASWLIKYDTSGHYQWMRSQGDNSLNAVSALSNDIGRLVLQDTLIHYLKVLRASGVPLMPSVTSQRGIYDFVYTPQGNLLSATRLPLSDSLMIINMSNPCSLYEPSNTLYVSIVAETLDRAYGTATFDASRNLISLDTFTTTGAAYIGHKACGFRYGNAQYYFGSFFGSDCTFKGQTFINPGGSLGRFGFVMKLDLNNNLIWRKAIDGIGIADTGPTTMYENLSNGKLIITGLAKNIIIGNDSMLTPGITGKIPIVIFDSLGNLQKMDYIRNNDPAGQGLGENGIEIACFNDNIYIGGALKDSIWLGNSGYKTHGGPTDFFIAKYGYNCNCTPPVSAFTHTTPNAAGLVSFTYAGTPGADSVRWNFGDGGTSTLLSPNHTFGMGNHTVCLTVYNACGGTQSCQPVDISCPQPAAAFSYTLAGTTVNMTYTGSTPVDSVRWLFAPGQTGTGNTASHNYGAPGSYNLCVIAYKDCGRDTACQLVTITCPQPNANFSYTVTNTTVNVSYTGSTPTDSIRWVFAPGQTATGNTASHNFNMAGTYTICVKAFRGCGSDTLCQPVTVSCPQPNAAFSHTASNTTVNVTYTGSTPVDSVRWTFAPGQTAMGSTASYTYSAPGTYQVCVIAYKGCGSDTTCQPVTLTCPAPEAAFSYTASGRALQFTYTGSTPVTAVGWRFGDGQLATGNTASHTYSNIGDYTVCVKSSNSCGVDSNCRTVTVDNGVGVDNITHTTTILLYPNPALQTVIVERAQPGTELALFDVAGKCLQKITVTQSPQKIDVSALAPGIYTFRVLSGIQQGSWRFIKQ